jgi:hypothetical protein
VLPAIILAMTIFEKARIKYKPDLIEYLLVAETPPKRDSKRFFYFENVGEQDSLFLEIMKCLYPAETSNLETKSIRLNKSYFLRKFQKDGFYLIDSLDNPFEERYSSKKKEELIKAGQKELLIKIRSLYTEVVKVILIAAPVFKANYSFLIAKGINVINKCPIYFPGSGGQKQFREKFETLIR